MKYTITIEGEGTQDVLAESLKELAMLVGVDGNLAEGDSYLDIDTGILLASLTAVKPDSRTNNMSWDEMDN